MAQNPTNIEFQIFTPSKGLHKLDIEQTTDFPLAITYSIKDVQDPSSSKGSYSKTFSIPATKHNNKVLKNLYSDSLYETFQYIEEYRAEIFIDGMLVLEGQFNIKGTTHHHVPKSYECVVFGENYKWVNALSELNLCDIDFDAGNFFPAAPAVVTISKTQIENTWEFGQAGEFIDSIQTHIVYPLVNNGKWNFVNGYNDAIVTPSDMSPAFYIYNMVKCIFGAQGYTLQSLFFESEFFRRLVSYLPKADFVNAPQVLEDFSFEYEATTFGAWSDYKTPLNYNDPTSSNNCAAVVGNTWHGQMTDMALVTATSDPAGLITAQNITPKFNVDSPTNFGALSSLDKRTIAGWNWMCYGFANLSQPRVPWIWEDSCGNLNQNAGLNFGCISCDIVNGDSNVGITMNTSVFQTSFLGVYYFNALVVLEMDNDYEINNPVAAYDLLSVDGGAATSSMTQGTGNGGTNAICEYSSGGFDGWESVSRGTTYVFNTHLIHYKESTGRYHIVASASERKKNPNNPSAPNYYCASYPLSGPDLTAKLGFTDVQVEILSSDDKVFVYSEVTAEMNIRQMSSQNYEDQIVGLTQMKYRQKNAKLSGGLTSALVEGGDVILASLLPCDVLQLDWVNGLTGLFNLFWQSDEATKTIIVEPRGMFFDSPSSAIDWSKKIDQETPQTDKFIYDALKRNLCFTYENDSADGFVEERNRRRGQKCELGSHSLNLGQLYVNEEQRIGSEFYSPSYMFYDKTISNNFSPFKQPFIPVIHGEYSSIWSASNNDELPDKVNDYAPRILSWYGLQNLNQADGIDSGNTWRWSHDNVLWSWENLTSYPFAGVYCDQANNVGGSITIGSITYDNPSLYFENSLANAVESTTPFETNHGLYEIFWERNILSMLSRPKIKTINVKLTTLDIAQLDYRKLIYIEGKQSGTYWIINRIIDYKVGSNVLTRVELYEYTNTRPVKGSLPHLDEGFGDYNTAKWTDYTPVLPQLPNKLEPQQVNTNLGIDSPTLTPILNVGTQGNSQATEQNIPEITGKSMASNYFDDGARAPVNSGGNNSSNIGQNQNINVGSISIGNNQLIQQSNKIVIGDGNNANSFSNIEMTANGKTAFGIQNDAIFREGGGGVVYFEDASGDIREVMTGVITGVQFNGRTQKIFYTRLTMNEE